MNKLDFISDIVLQCTQSAVSDDSEISQEQIAFWGTYQLNQIVTQEINTELKNGKFIPPIYITMEDYVATQVEYLECQAKCIDRLFIELTGEVLDLPKDAGIVRVITDEGDQVLKSSLESLDYLKNLRFAKPSRTNPIYYRQLKKVFIEGVNQAEMDLGKITVYYVKKQDLGSLDDTDEIIMSDQIRPLVIDAVVQRLKLEMYGSEADAADDGIDVKNAAYHNVIANPNNRIDNQQPQQ